MISVGMLFCIMNGTADLALGYMLEGADSALELMLGLGGSYILWLGIMKVAERAGLVTALSRRMEKPLRLLMPNVGSAAAPITLNLAANFFGLGNAATPFGIEAMKELNKNRGERSSIASNDVCMFLALNSSCIQLIPTSVIAIRAACGSSNPSSIILPTLISSILSSILTIILCKLCGRLSHDEMG
ncbi:MAG: nucleoside recognition domain-containing protein [Clostridiales bacterium]|nr:nucleoside recognition domain-containing protein [Clostridiales bacterium]